MHVLIYPDNLIYIFHNYKLQEEDFVKPTPELTTVKYCNICAHGYSLLKNLRRHKWKNHPEQTKVLMTYMYVPKYFALQKC